MEIIVLDRSPLYKVTQQVENRRYFVAYAHDIPTLEQHVTLADLVEVLNFHSKTGRQRPRPRRA